LDHGTSNFGTSGRDVTKSDGWEPQRYALFARERDQPFYDLLALVRPRRGMRIADLGCGDGHLTRVAHEKLGAASTLGIDSSAEMLPVAPSVSAPSEQPRFARAAIETWQPDGPIDLVLSNAALHWIDDHSALFTRLSRWIAPGGQLAIQMPDNESHPSHRVARELAAEQPFALALEGSSRHCPVLSPERYAEFFEAQGYSEQHVRLQIYGHRMKRADAVVDWVLGSVFSWYRARLLEPMYQQFVAEYRRRLLGELGLAPEAPYFYTYRRLLLWATR
jgi:trans-aconitate 2-methyltransferase